MKNETRIAMLQNRVSVLEQRQKDNYNIIKAIKREIKGLEGRV